MKPFLKTHYQEQVVPQLKKSLGLENPHQLPKIEKIILNTGFGVADKQAVASAVEDIEMIAGQKPVITKARKSISNFKLREGMPIGAKVTLRGARMYDFLYRFMAVALPSIRDFQGISSRMDGSGNYTFGVTDHSIFPEINTDGTRANMGMDITIVTSATEDTTGLALLSEMGMPFRKKPAAAEAVAA